MFLPYLLIRVFQIDYSWRVGKKVWRSFWILTFLSLYISDTTRNHLICDGLNLSQNAGKPSQKNLLWRFYITSWIEGHRLNRVTISTKLSQIMTFLNRHEMTQSPLSTHPAQPKPNIYDENKCHRWRATCLTSQHGRRQGCWCGWMTWLYGWRGRWHGG
jgi:hypothetical protein